MTFFFFYHFSDATSDATQVPEGLNLSKSIMIYQFQDLSRCF